MKEQITFQYCMLRKPNILKRTKHLYFYINLISIIKERIMKVIIESIKSNYIDISTKAHKELQIVSWDVEYKITFKNHHIDGRITIPENDKILLDENYLKGFIKTDFHNFK